VSGPWDRLLDALEADALALERDGGRPGPFRPPADLGPLPPHLAGRARRVQDRLDAAVAATDAALAGLRRELALTARVGGATVERPAPRFVDTSL
jgi:hypothetical protein